MLTFELIDREVMLESENVRESMSVSKRLFTLIVQDCTEIVKLYSPQIEGNKDCKFLRCVNFYQVGSRLPNVAETTRIGEKLCSNINIT